MLNIKDPDSSNHLVYLPFESSSPVFDRTILSSWASYKGVTIFGYSAASGGPHTIAFIPALDRDPKSIEDRMSKSSVVFVSSGLERAFIYRGRQISDDESLGQLKSLVGADPIDLIGIVRPKDARGLEVSNGRIEEPEATEKIGNTRFYPGKDAANKSTRIEIRYEVKAPPLVTLLLTYLTQLAGALAAPLVTILFFSVQENLRPKTRRVILTCLVVLQIGIALTLGYFAWAIRNDASSIAFVNWLIVLITAGASALPLALKRERPTDPLAVRP